MLELAGAIAIVVGIGYLINAFLIFLDGSSSTYRSWDDSSGEDDFFQDWAKRDREERKENE